MQIWGSIAWPILNLNGGCIEEYIEVSKGLGFID